VGEYTDDEWQLVELESSGKIGSYDEELERLNNEIHRLEEVQGLITPETTRQPEPVPALPPEPEIIPEHFDIQNPPNLTEMPPLTLVRESEPIPPPTARLGRPACAAGRHSWAGGVGPSRRFRPRRRSRPHPHRPDDAPWMSWPSCAGDTESPAQRARRQCHLTERDERLQPLAKTLGAECGSSTGRPSGTANGGAELAAL
jgi:hypothetical protein